MSIYDIDQFFKCTSTHYSFLPNSRYTSVCSCMYIKHTGKEGLISTKELICMLHSVAQTEEYKGVIANCNISGHIQ